MERRCFTAVNGYHSSLNKGGTARTITKANFDNTNPLFIIEAGATSLQKSFYTTQKHLCGIEAF